MTLATSTPVASYDRTAGVLLDLSDVLADMVRPDNTKFLNFIGISGQATQVKHTWVQDALNPMTALTYASANGVLADTDTDVTLTVATDLGYRFPIGTIFKDAAAGKSELMQVIARTGDALTITRSYGSTTGETHGTGTTPFTCLIVSHANQEGQDPPDDITKSRSDVSNYTQIFQYGVNISTTLRAIKAAGVTDEFSYQVARRLLEAHRELDTTIINGIKAAATASGSDTIYRTMQGMIGFVSAATGNVTTTAEALTMSVVNKMAESIWDDGGEPNFILVPGKQKRAISAFDQSARRSVYDATVAGYVVDKIITDLGFVLDVVTDPSVPNDICIMGDRAKVKVLPLVNDAMRVEELAKTGRATKSQVTGQYTMECRNALEAFAIHTALTWS